MRTFVFNNNKKEGSHIFIIVAESRTRAKEFAKEKEDYSNIEPEEINTHEEGIALELVV